VEFCRISVLSGKLTWTCVSRCLFPTTDGCHSSPQRGFWEKEVWRWAIQRTLGASWLSKGGQRSVSHLPNVEKAPVCDTCVLGAGRPQ
jgi:hypothetical protein